MTDNTLRELVYGKGAHVDPVACVEDISAELAARRVPGYPHSIWQIVLHVNYWMDHDLAAVASEKPRYPDHAIESWADHPAPANESQWHATRQHFVELLARVAILANSDSALLDRIVEDVGVGNIPRRSTVHTRLWQIAAHNSYHVGQIALLRRQAGAWPPERGGDTW
jgi:uncharacterized damage-inducible protein DinB